jgi:peptide/nickel transport system permease protein
MSRGTARAVLRRLLASTATLVGVVTLVFLVVRLVPGDPVQNLLGEYADDQAVASLRARMHLDEPLWRQYALYLASVVDGSLGTSAEPGGVPRTVSSRLLAVLPATLDLAAAGLLFALAVALPLGFGAAVRRGTWLDRGSGVLAVLSASIPVIWLGPALLYLFGVRLRWLPLPGQPIDGLDHLLLPGVVLGLALSGKLTRLVRTTALESLAATHVFLARARGIPGRTVLLAHVARAALPPVLTVLGMQLAALLGGAILTEKIFGRPGVGSLLVDAIARRDYDLVQGTVIFVTAMYVAANLAVDLALLALDPRVRHAR